jgi:hypothetical protein
VQDQRRPAELGLPESFSDLTGLHTMHWNADARKTYVGSFNACVDRVKHALGKLGTRVDASKLSKDKTRVLQFIPTVDLLEKALSFLLKPKSAAECDALSPEQLVEAVAAVDIQTLLSTFSTTSIPSSVSLASVNASKALTEFYCKQYILHENMAAEVARFREDRDKLSVIYQPRPCVLFALAQHDSVILPGAPSAMYKTLVQDTFSWKDFAREPLRSDREVRQAKFELMVLALAGLIHLDGRVVTVLHFAPGDESCLQCLARLQLMDPALSLEEINSVVPAGERSVSTRLDSGAADTLAQLLSKYSSGEEVTSEQIQACPDPWYQPSIASQDRDAAFHIQSLSE